MITQCPECELQVSDKAITCPHCGYPLDKTANIKTKRRCKKKRLKLPNGFGRISKITGENLRHPYRVIITTGKDANGKPIGKLLKPQAFFDTYNEAYAALIDYNRNPYDLDDDITVKELYERWTKEYFESLESKSSIRTITSAWAYCSSVYSMRVKDIRPRHIKGCMEDGIAIVKGKEKHTTPNIKGRIKSLFNLMLDYATEYELTDKNYARLFQLSDDIIKEKEETANTHIAFTEDEMIKLWKNYKSIPYADIVLIQCYSGWRPQELGLIKLENVDLEKWIFVGGMKTEVGFDRTVPIHEKIKELVKARYDEAVSLGSEYLFNCVDGATHRGNIKLTYDKYSYRFEKIIKKLELNPEHKAHDPRKTFITMAKDAKVDEYAIKRIVGHKISDLTERVYTERPISWLSSEMSKIKGPAVNES